MNINGVSAQVSGLLNVNRGLDNEQRAAGDLQGTGQPDPAVRASGPAASQSVQEAAVSQQVAAPSTQVVVETQGVEESREALGSLIDTSV